MRRILLIAKRDFLAVVRSKAFVIGLLAFPLLFGGGFLVTAVMQTRTNAQDRRIAIVDRTGVMAATVIQVAEEKNRWDMYDKLTGRQAMPRYEFEEIKTHDGDWEAQRLALSDHVRRRELYAFVEIGQDALHPPPGKPVAPVSLYSSAGVVDQFQLWFDDALNDGFRRARLAQLGLSLDHSSDLLASVPLQNMNLVSRDPGTGAIVAPRKKSQTESFAIPYFMVMLLVMMVLISANPMLTTVAQDKLQRVFEMLLASVTPLELITGKVLASIASSLVSSAFYIAGGILALQGMAMIGLVPFAILPWFFVYLVAEVTMLCALGAALGSACGNPQDAQHLVIFLMLPMIVPLFLLGPVLQQPGGTSATMLSLIPPFTPLLMLMRQAMPGGVPAWQPWAGLAGVLVWSVAGTWAASRVFRIGILFQGTTPKPAEMLRWAIRG